MNITAEQSAKKSTKEIPNTYKINLKLWKSFKTDDSKKAFNNIYSKTLKNQTVVVHPHSPWLDETHWKTICWNVACLAAWEVCKEPYLEKGNIVKDIKIKTGKTVKKRIIK
jgi:hypothetical protein